MDVYDFIKLSKPYHLKINDIKKLRPGDELDVVIWDRNFEEYHIWENCKSEKLYDSKEFFKENRHKITYQGYIKWDIHFPYGETIQHPVHLNTSGLETNWEWYAISQQDGYVNITNEILKSGEIIPKHWKSKRIHWTEFPETTRVGWRGPIMLWEDLDKMPNVYYKKI